jgi:putative two-component system response regulator
MANVLILEDNAEIAVLYERIFAHHKTRILGDVPEAIGYLRRDCPDLVIMDFHLPSGSGVDVLNYMRSQPNLRDIPVLGVSVDDLLKHEAIEQGMNAFLTKPIELSELIQTANRLISSRKKAPSADLRAALNDYAAAYQSVYRRMPKGVWTGSEVLIDGQACDVNWLRGETRRLRSLTQGGEPRNYLHRLLEKIRLI